MKRLALVAVLTSLAAASALGIAVACAIEIRATRATVLRLDLDVLRHENRIHAAMIVCFKCSGSGQRPPVPGVDGPADGFANPNVWTIYPEADLRCRECGGRGWTTAEKAFGDYATKGEVK